MTANPGNWLRPKHPILRPLTVPLTVALKAGFCSASFTRPKRDPFRQHRGLLVQLQLGLAAQQCRKSTDAKWHLYYWYGIPGALGEAFTAAWAGASDGVGFNFPMLVDCSSYNKYKDNSAYWIGDAVGVLTGVVTLTAAADIRIPSAFASRSYAPTDVANSAARFVAAGNGKIINTQSPKLAQQIAKVVASLRITGTPPAGVY